MFETETANPTDWETYFYLDQTNGQISVRQSLRNAPSNSYSV